MLASKLRPVSRHAGGSLLRSAKGILPKATTTTTIGSDATRFISTAQTEEFQKQGILDDQGLTVFDTLHEMQVNSCKVFTQNELFGTYDEPSNSFLFMTYDEYNQKVNQCRALLKDLGTCGKLGRNKKRITQECPCVFSIAHSLFH